MWDIELVSLTLAPQVRARPNEKPSNIDFWLHEMPLLRPKHWMTSEAARFILDRRART